MSGGVMTKSDWRITDICLQFLHSPQYSPGAGGFVQFSAWANFNASVRRPTPFGPAKR